MCIYIYIYICIICIYIYIRFYVFIVHIKTDRKDCGLRVFVVFRVLHFWCLGFSFGVWGCWVQDDRSQLISVGTVYEHIENSGKLSFRSTHILVQNPVTPGLEILSSRQRIENASRDDFRRFARPLLLGITEATKKMLNVGNYAHMTGMTNSYEHRW